MALSPPAAAVDAAVPRRHGWVEDVHALVTGSLLAALGILLFRQAGLLAGGTVGIALLLSYASGLDVAWCFVLANLPFYALAVLRMGSEFTLKTFAAVALTSLFAAWLPQGLAIHSSAAPLAAVLGGLLCGVAILVLFRHRASLGGLNVLVLYLGDKLGLSPGKTQMALDALIVFGGGLWLGDASRVASSVLAVVVLNLVLAVNHRPDRYHP